MGVLGCRVVELQRVRDAAKGPETVAEQRYATRGFMPDGTPLEHGGGRMSRYPVRQ